ncbi:hypothetical protein KY290_024432 [Solanum tuberosum]|uniref:Uncharacterized protein n=1 Tax=Solanum tuberosum TaxID=4113 RepID=A0ABQ7USP3_SOLTU|nr:hypothetical protein KY290_024432 [Solanum tuberosum]
MLGSLNEIDPLVLLLHFLLCSFYTSSCAPSPTKMSTIPPVNIIEPHRPTPQYPIDVNNLAPSFQTGPQPSVLYDCLFEGDLPENRYSESNILAASENLVVESLTEMREGARNEDGSRFVEDLFGDTEPVFDRTPDIGLPPSSDSEDDEEDNTLLLWVI